jgi:molecular chaperone DnaK (HSP70)
MQASIEKARKMLTADTETQLHIDCLLDDEDLNQNLKRTEFESLIAGKIASLKVLLEKSL